VRTATALLLLILLSPAAAADTPKADHRVINLVNRKGDFEAVRQEVEPLLVAIAEEEDGEKRAALAKAFAEEHGRRAIEVIVRYRGAHLVPVLAALADHEDWFVRRLAILGLQRNLAASELDRVVARLSDENVLVREIAATTVAILHWAGRKDRGLFPRSERSAPTAPGPEVRDKSRSAVGLAGSP